MTTQSKQEDIPDGLGVVIWRLQKLYGPTNRSIAEALGISESMVSSVFSGKKKAPKSMLSAVNMRKVIRYVRD